MILDALSDKKARNRICDMIEILNRVNFTLLNNFILNFDYF